ncbi:hypothetical protein A464_1617 [Salmonella bongori N268-08]|uniref:Uncharacterized protein n=1 Tax=Salmonella bongori N268-08 TaxID=1197719 RepID=S5NEY6_SALBN|nr:hypothetical protein A464_1617 [Salmonella bongori N268-08]
MLLCGVRSLCFHYVTCYGLSDKKIPYAAKATKQSIACNGEYGFSLILYDRVKPPAEHPTCNC